MTKWVTTSSENDAILAADRMWYNYLMNYASSNEAQKLIRNGDSYYNKAELDNMSYEEVIGLKSCGDCQGQIQYLKGLTTKYTDYFNAHNNPNLWVLCPEPASFIMEGVTNISMLDKDVDWWPSRQF